jgi:hypothetical protein
VSGIEDEPDGAAEIERLERQFAVLIARYDRQHGIAGSEVERAIDADIDPMLERDLQLVLAGYLAKLGPGSGNPIELERAAAEGKLEQMLNAQVKPLFDALFATAMSHARAANEAIQAGRDPAARRHPNLTLDLTDILEDDS